MSGKILHIAEANGDEGLQHITLDVLTEGIYMNDGVAFMPFMEDKYYFLEVEEGTAASEVESDFVEYLYKIRKANREKQKIEHTWFAGPNALKIRERVFIAGKIFPALSISYSWDFNSSPADCSTSKMEVRSLTMAQLRLLFGETFGEYKAFAINYISIDNDKIKIFLPIYTEIGIDYTSLLLDFLTNGPKTMIAVSHGEFSDMARYELATGKKKLEEGCWLTKDRKDGTYGNFVWQTACMDIIKNKWQGVFAPFKQIYDFYNYIDSIAPKFLHKTRWAKGAKALVDALTVLEGGTTISARVTANDIQTILSELNLGICDYAITQFYELFYGIYAVNPLDTLEKAYQFDKNFVTYEQGTVAPPIYNKTSRKTIERFQAMADKDPQQGWHGATGLFNFVTPEFDDPWDAKVTDAGFRIDLPLLMLWLDRHKPTSAPFKGKVDKDGYLKEEYKKIIRVYEIK